MAHEIDTRDFSRTVADDAQLNSLEASALSVSESLSGDHAVAPVRLNPLTGSPAELRSTGATPADGSYIDRALAHMQAATQAFGFASGIPP